MEQFTPVRHATSWLAWSDRWPGLLAGGPSEAALAEALPRSIAEFAHWLGEHGEAGPSGPATFSTAWDAREADASGRDPCLEADRLALSDDEFERCMRHVVHSQDDLRRAADLPAEVLHWAPAGLEPGHADPWAPDIRTAAGILTHALQFEVFYRDGLRDGAAAGIFERVGEASAEHAATVARLRGLPRTERTRVFHPQRYNPGRTASEPDEWTLRKVSRRLISHNRAHAAEILQRRTWVLLGPPNQ